MTYIKTKERTSKKFNEHVKNYQKHRPTNLIEPLLHLADQNFVGINATLDKQFHCCK